MSDGNINDEYSIKFSQSMKQYMNTRSECHYHCKWVLVLVSSNKFTLYPPLR